MADNRPLDFGKFWYELGKELSDIPMLSEIAPIPLRSNEFCDLYGVSLTSVGPYKIFGYLSIPKGEGPFPTIYYVPKNGSVLEIIPQGTSNRVRSRFITFSIACRGMRNSDKPYAAMYPGQLTDGLDSLGEYIYRGIAADTIRGLDFVISRPEVDKTKVVAWGNDNAILAAALHGAVTHLVATPSYLVDTLEAAANSTSYPLEEFSDYIRFYPEREKLVEEILQYFNLKWHAQSVDAISLIMTESNSGIYSRSFLQDFTDRIQGDVTIHQSEGSTYKDGLFAEKWLTNCFFGKDEKPIVPPHWDQ
ncbi:MAG: hypothetical protein CL887_05405 [Dehalococcoidia bacterium]|nr:hypothetical protein [Dehalococcoidia bacterium]